MDEFELYDNALDILDKDILVESDFDELDKIISSRVFSKNNALIYELDNTSR